MNKLTNNTTDKTRKQLLIETKQKLHNMAKTSRVGGGDAAKYFQLEHLF